MFFLRKTLPTLIFIEMTLKRLFLKRLAKDTLIVGYNHQLKDGFESVFSSKTFQKYYRFLYFVK